MAYKRENSTSYALGAFATLELIKYRPSEIVKIYTHKSMKVSQDIEKIISFAKSHNIQVVENSHLIENISKKENIYIMGEFRKYTSELKSGNQIVLYQPSDMGNLGTICRTSLGFGVDNIVLITPCADIFNPKTIRASMGAVFGLNIVEYDSFESYAKVNDIKKYLFMLGSKQTLQDLVVPNEPVALVFGNEASGLPKSVLKFGTPIFIRHNDKIDSLNLANSVAIALFKFSK